MCTVFCKFTPFLSNYPYLILTIKWEGSIDSENRPLKPGPGLGPFWSIGSLSATVWVIPYGIDLGPRTKRERRVALNEANFSL